ncbi:MAG: bifunctional glutamate N-acetyltransferase/amino-acid acetyltransferase ArgJ [Desulfobacterales bacterium]|nr:bifunctional glutamate N-acetyltransferase/amino-acid acetyltransferase ArgJ [Desulfobacterales bacterium]
MSQLIRCKGFQAAGIAAGIKKNGRKDLGLIFSQVPATVAGVFTRNQVQAAPVLLDRKRIAAGTCQAVVVNSGNANCCTGPQGMIDAAAMAGCVAEQLGIDANTVLAASTGVIGVPLPMGKIAAAVPQLVDALSPDGFEDLSRAIMTTDTVPKMVHCQAALDGKAFNILGIAKGAGMIRPDMATLLCFICTDLQAPPGLLYDTLKSATDRSFNRITIDGDMSTNDTVILMANGLSEAAVETEKHRDIFQQELDRIMLRLAREIVKDGEGVTKFVEIIVTGAVTREDARRVAFGVSDSNLVKTALFGQDANWGRILAAAGSVGVPLVPEHMDIYFDDVRMVRQGMGCGEAAEKAATSVLQQPEFAITIHLNAGEQSASVFTCDLSIDYVKINADYRS